MYDVDVEDCTAHSPKNERRKIHRLLMFWKIRKHSRRVWRAATETQENEDELISNANEIESNRKLLNHFQAHV